MCQRREWRGGYEGIVGDDEGGETERAKRGRSIMHIVSATEPLKASKSRGLVNLWCGL